MSDAIDKLQDLWFAWDQGSMIGMADTINAIRPALDEMAEARAEVARLTAELAAARAVPVDVEAAITAIARAISDATASQPATVGGLLATAPDIAEREGQYVADRIGLTYDLSTESGRGRAIKAMHAAEEIIARGPLPKGG